MNDPAVPSPARLDGASTLCTDPRMDADSARGQHVESPYVELAVNDLAERVGKSASRPSTSSPAPLPTTTRTLSVLTSLRSRGVQAALLSAVLFGAPAAKLLLDSVSPWLLAGLLCSGSGIGLGRIRLIRRSPRVHLAQDGAASPSA
jgi:hypothetical protein